MSQAFVEWQREHAAALEALQQAQRAYHRTIAGSAFAGPTEGPTAIELQKESLEAVEAARIRLDDIRSRRPAQQPRIAWPDVRLKKTYSSREVAALTGLTARQLQLWDAGGLLSPAIPSRKTDAGGYTERRYTPIELFELIVLADLRRRGFTIQ